MLLGLAGALLLTQICRSARAAYYTLVTAPILMPGMVIGIATVLFWDRVAGALVGARRDSIFYDGIFLTMLGQSCFIAAYCMLVFVARLQRFDEQLLRRRSTSGATNTQAFRKILLPYPAPGDRSAAVIAFLAASRTTTPRCSRLATTPRSRSRWRRRSGSGSIPRSARWR